VGHSLSKAVGHDYGRRLLVGKVDKGSGHRELLAAIEMILGGQSGMLLARYTE